MTIQPLGDRVLIKPLEEQEQKVGNIIIPDTAKEKPQKGVVKQVGTGKATSDGKTLPMNVKVGDKVFYSKYGGTEVKIDGDEYLIMSENDILGIIKEN